MKQEQRNRSSGTGAGHLAALVANAAGDIIELAGYAAVGMAGEEMRPLRPAETLPMPHGGEMMLLPDRRPVLYNLAQRRMEVVAQDPFRPGEPVYPVAVFNSPGYVITRSAAYRGTRGAPPLPLFSYGAVGWRNGRFQTPLIRVDWEPRQDLRRMPPEAIRAGIEQLRKDLPDNRLRAHLETCALTYGCPAGKNFFLGRYEAPLPTSRQCNARCLGCISLQPGGSGISCSQERIGFTPTPEEIADVALAHIRRVPRGAVVSFGQGCEGDPLMCAGVIEAAIARIRSRTDAGTIHLNSNASLPGELERLFDAGLDSLRVSLNSTMADGYHAYFRPRGYGFSQVLESIDLALARGRFVSLNYLNCPGVTDSPQEYASLTSFLQRHPIHMIQWRNLNYDPQRYWQAMNRAVSLGRPLGMKTVLDGVRAAFPGVRFGYFNPPREKWAAGDGKPPAKGPGARRRPAVARRGRGGRKAP